MNKKQDTIKGLIDLYQKKDYTNLIKDAENLLNKDNQDHIIYNIIGLSEKKLNKIDRAIDCFDKSIEIDVNYFVAYINKANLLSELEDYQSAISLLTSALEINPDSFEAKFNLGNCHFKLNQNKEAINFYKEALLINDKIEEIHINIGNAYLELKMIDEAIESFGLAKKLNPDNKDLSFYLGNIDFHKGNLKKQMKFMRKHWRKLIIIIC